MKSIIFTGIIWCFTTILFAQTKFSEFINTLDWSSTEKEIVEKYHSTIQARKHFYSDYDKTMSDYEITGIVVGDYNCKALVSVDSISKKLHSLLFSFGDLEKNKDAKTLTDEMDKILISLFGEPDKKENNEDYKPLKIYERIWYKEKYIISSTHQVMSDSNHYYIVVQGVDDKSNDFRVAKWGDSKSSIIQKEGKPNESKDDRLYFFTDKVAGLYCEVCYVFTNDKLTMSKYIFKPTHTNKNDYIIDFNNLVELMTEKYGKPNFGGPEWKNTLYKDDPDKYGFAVSMGHLSYRTGWFKETTEIDIGLDGDNFDFTLQIQYLSKKYKDIKQKEDIQNKLKDL